MALFSAQGVPESDHRPLPHLAPSATDKSFEVAIFKKWLKSDGISADASYRVVNEVRHSRSSEPKPTGRNGVCLIGYRARRTCQTSSKRCGSEWIPKAFGGRLATLAMSAPGIRR